MRRRILQAVVIAAMLNFAAFWLAAGYLGGDAVSGRVIDGHYFLSSHGHLREVSPEVFTYSKWHVYSVWITHPLAILSAVLLQRKP